MLGMLLITNKSSNYCSHVCAAFKRKVTFSDLINIFEVFKFVFDVRSAKKKQKKKKHLKPKHPDEVAKQVSMPSACLWNHALTCQVQVGTDERSIFLE